MIFTHTDNLGDDRTLYRRSSDVYRGSLVLQRGFEMWCHSAHQPCVEGGQNDGSDRDSAKDGLGYPSYGAPGGVMARLSRHLQSSVAAA